MREKDYIVSFRFPCDDFFTRHETNVCAANKMEAVAIIVQHLPQIEDVRAELGVVMLYGRPYNTIVEDVGRFGKNIKHFTNTAIQ